MLNDVGIRTQIKEVPGDSYFKDHIAAGDFDLALYSWPGTAFPATEARPIFAKPQPAADGSLLVEQNTRGWAPTRSTSSSSRPRVSWTTGGAGS
ncbi:hypothetical protein ACWV95_24755 [Streptomyces albus]